MIHTSDLRVDNDPQPLGLDHGTPTFSWVPLDTRRNITQQTYRILVSGSETHLRRNTGTLWDSGPVLSGQTNGIPYAGKPLTPAQSYWWKVCLTDQHGEHGDWSAPARFDTGLFSASEWTATWIGRGPHHEPRLDFDAINGAPTAEAAHGPIPIEVESALLRHEFSLAKPIRRAVVFVCGLGFYRLRLNGRQVGHNIHTPSKTDYREQVLFDAYDVTDMLAQGLNAVGLVLGNGWYNPVKTWWDWHMQWHGSKRALLQMHITCEDGSEMRLVTDPTWKTSLGPVREHCLYDGELYDARLEQPGWDMPGFNESGWLPANAVDAPGGILKFHSIEPIRITETIRPKQMWEASPGVFVYDMGQNFSGFVRLRVTGPRDTEVCLRHAENVHPDGTLDCGTNGRARNIDRYILKGEGTECFEPSFVYHGFQYVELSGFPGAPTLDSVTGCVLHTDSPQTGEFHCSNDLINHIHHCTVWGQRSNMMGLPTDDNQRDERLGWMADGHLVAEQFMCNFEPVRFYRKWLRDMKHGQNPETGSVPYIVPRPHFLAGSSTPAWSSAYPLVAWYLYEYTGDRSILEEHFAGICRYVDYLSTQATGHILPKDRYGDHLSITDGWCRSEPLLVSTWFYYYDAILASRMAGILGRAEQEKQYAGLAELIRTAFNEKYFSKETHRYGTGSQCDQILPLWLHMEPNGERWGVLSKLVRSIMNDNHGHLRVGILGAKYALDLLMAENRHDVIWAWATCEDYPSIGFMTKGYTTLSETWSREFSNNHIMWGHIDTWFYQGLAGIRTAKNHPGYDTVVIQPYIPAELDRVRAAIHTPRGRVASAWSKQDDTLALNVSIPVNTTAEIRLPLKQLRDQTIYEGTRRVWDDGFCGEESGILAGSTQGDFVTFKVGSGHYHFSCKWINQCQASQTEQISPWRADCGSSWYLSRLLDPGDVTQAPCVSLADPLDWRPIAGTPFIDVHGITQGADGLVYLAKRIRVAQSGKWLLNIGHDGGMRLFLDGKQAASEGLSMNPAPKTRTAAKLTLSAGEHELVVAFDLNKGNGWGFFATWEIPYAARKNMAEPVFPEPVV